VVCPTLTGVVTCGTRHSAGVTWLIMLAVVHMHHGLYQRRTIAEVQVLPSTSAATQPANTSRRRHHPQAISTAATVVKSCSTAAAQAKQLTASLSVDEHHRADATISWICRHDAVVCAVAPHTAVCRHGVVVEPEQVLIIVNWVCRLVEVVGAATT
jgi:hypothetical protein